MKDKIASYQPHFLSLLRAVSALVFFAHGTQKILGFPFTDKVPPVGSLPWTAGLFELILGFLLIVGFKTRPVAFVLSGVMAAAYFIAHYPKGFFPALNGGDAAILFSFVFLYFSVAGGGNYSVDALLDSKKKSL